MRKVRKFENITLEINCSGYTYIKIQTGITGIPEKIKQGHRSKEGMEVQGQRLSQNNCHP